MKNLLALVLPGILIAATGVGAGDLATASFSGSQLGIAVLWAVVAGGVMKYVLTEGIARWQLVKGQTLLDGMAQQLGPVFTWGFLAYLVLWSFFVGSALISACGVAMHALIPIMPAGTGKGVFGIGCSAVGLALVRLGSFQFFEKLMSLCIGSMFIVVVATAIALWPGTEAVLRGTFIPTIPDTKGQGATWTVALIGGVGGTLTIFCYGYWIQEKNRTGVRAISTCQWDLIIGYTVTVLFGMAMVIIGSTLPVQGKGANLIVQLAANLEGALGATGKWLFLVGAFFAIFSSLLGVWQAVPYLFADVAKYLTPKTQRTTKALDKTRSYQVFQILLATIPAVGLMVSFKEVQKVYAVVGTLFMPFLAVGLLYFNNQKSLRRYKNGALTNTLLVTTLAFFSFVAWVKLAP